MLTDKEKLDALIEQYKVLSGESQSYLQEMMKCFLYAAIVIAVGVGANLKEIGDIKAYMPLALLGLIIYFLTLGFMFVSNNVYKGEIEKRINKLSEPDVLFDYESKYKPHLISVGVLPVRIWGKLWRIGVMPNPLLGVFLIGGFYIMANQTKTFEGKTWLLFLILSIMVILSIYVFVIVPRIIKKNINDWKDVPFIINSKKGQK